MCNLKLYDPSSGIKEHPDFNVVQCLLYWRNRQTEKSVKEHPTKAELLPAILPVWQGLNNKIQA